MKIVREANEHNHHRLVEFMNNLGHWGRDMDFVYDDKDGLVLWSDPPEHEVYAFSMDELREYIPDLIDVKEIEIRECLGIDDDSDWDNATVTNESVVVEIVTRFLWICPSCHTHHEIDYKPERYTICDNCEHVYKIL